MEKYFALYNHNLGGFKAGYSDTDKDVLLSDAAGFLIKLAETEEEQLELEELKEEEVLKRNNFEIVEVTLELYNKVLESTQYHHSSIV